MERKSRAQTESFAFIAIVAGVLILANVLAVLYFGRWDLTKRQLYSLSDGTKRIVRSLHDQLTVTVYFTPNQPPPASEDERVLRDQLDEYRSTSHNRIQIRYVVPDNDARRAQADAAGCTKQPLQAINMREQQATIQEVYRCISFEYLGQRDKIEFLQPGSSGMEYEISSIVKNLIDRTQPNHHDRTIGFLGGHGENTPEEGMQYLAQMMEQERLTIHTRTVNLNNGDADVPSDINGLIIANPSRQISDRELRKLDAYLMHGGSIAIFASGVNFPTADPGSATGTLAEHHLNDWLDGYGIHINGDVVLDPRSTDAAIRRGRQQARIHLVTWPLITATSGTPSESDLRSQGGLDPSFPAVFRLSEFVTPYPSSITLNAGQRRTAGGTLSTFALTGPMSVSRSSDFDLNVVEILQQGHDIFESGRAHGPYPVGIALVGRFHSAFTGHPAAPAAGNAVVPASVPETAEHDARLLVVSSGNMFALESLRTMVQLSGGQKPGNITLLFNMFDWLSQDTDLLAVRAKDTSDPTLRRDISDGRRNFFQYFSIIGLPLIIGLLGLVVTRLRRSRRKNYLVDYAVRTASSAQ